MTGSADAIAENRPTGERPSPIAWLAALCIPAAVLVASIGVHPQFFDVTIVQSDGQADSRGPVPLYRRGGATFYFTTADLLHPEAFGAPGAFIDAVAFDVVPATERGPDAGFPTWILQIARALKLQDADGHAIGAPSLQEADTKLLDELATVFVPGLTLRRGMTRSLALPEASTYRARSGLRVLTAMAVARGTAAPPSDGTDSLLGSALALAAKDVVNSGGTGLGVPCIPSLGGAGLLSSCRNRHNARAGGRAFRGRRRRRRQGVDRA